VHSGIFKGITARVLVVSGAITLVLGAAFVLLIVSMTGQRSAGRLAIRSQEAITAGSELQKSVLNLENGLRGYVATGRQRSLEPWRSGLRDYPAQVRRLEALVADEPDQQASARLISEEINDYVNLWGRPLLDLAGAQLQVARSVIVNGTGRTRIDTIRTRFERLFEQERAVARAREQRAEGRSSLAIGAGFAGLVLVFLLAGGIALFLRRFVVRPVLAVSGASRALAEGDTSARVPETAEDEIGDLAKAFNSMAESLERNRVEIAQRTRELERSNEELDRFAAVTSHDLQAPLVTISMYVQLLERRHGSELGEGNEIVDRIAAATGQARDLVRDLLEYSRAGRGEMRAEEVEARQLVSEVVDLLAGPLQESGASVSVGDLPVVSVDCANMRQVFQNLIANAVKFADTDPQVSVTAERKGAFWEFAVADNGIGMDPQHADEIFKPFQRLHGDGKYPGAGLGLAVCQRIVEQHGGRIWVDTEPGKGSTFRFTIPVAEDVGNPAPPRDEPVLA
jgi:signal transduction histidine kinase